MPPEDENDPKDKDPKKGEGEDEGKENLPAGKKGKPDDEDPPKVDPLVQKLQKDLTESQETLKKNQKEFKTFQDKLKNLFVDEEEEKKKKEKNAPNAELKEYMEKQFEKINARLDEKEHEEVMESLADNLGLKSAEQKEFFEFKIMRAQEEKGSALSEKEIKKIGEGVKKLHGGEKEEQNKGSSVNETDAGPAVDIGDTASITYKAFLKMNIMERSELFRANPKMHEQFIAKENEEFMNVD